MHEQFWRFEVTDDEGWGRAWAQAEKVNGVIFEDVFTRSMIYKQQLISNTLYRVYSLN